MRNPFCRSPQPKRPEPGGYLDPVQVRHRSRRDVRLFQGAHSLLRGRYPEIGRAYAALKLREIDGVYGGELAGHYYFRDFFYSDSGLLASILILNVVAKMKAQGISLSQLIARIEKYKNSGEINFRLEDKKGAMDAVRDYFMGTEQSTAYMDFDGYRVEFPQWWFNIRPSNTEPYLRFLCEATSQELLDEKVSKVREILVEQFGAE